jgi:hypothetical protein
MAEIVEVLAPNLRIISQYIDFILDEDFDNFASLITLFFSQE